MVIDFIMAGTIAGHRVEPVALVPLKMRAAADSSNGFTRCRAMGSDHLPVACDLRPQIQLPLCSMGAFSVLMLPDPRGCQRSLAFRAQVVRMLGYMDQCPVAPTYVVAPRYELRHVDVYFHVRCTAMPHGTYYSEGRDNRRRGACVACACLRSNPANLTGA